MASELTVRQREGYSGAPKRVSRYVGRKDLEVAPPAGELPSASVVTGNKPQTSRVFARVMPVARGLYALRYLSADDAAEVPQITVTFAPDTQGVETFWGPNATGPVLREPGDAVVISSEADASIVVTIFVNGAAKEDRVKLKLDRLDRISDADQSLIHKLEERPANVREVQDDILPVYLSGHIAQRGDVVATSGKWLGARGGSGRVEGFTVHWPGRPIGVDIGYDCVVSDYGAIPETLTGDFAGARQRGLPITSVSFRLRDEKASQYELHLEAAFDDGSVVRAAGQEVTANGKTHKEAVTGLCLLVRKRNSNASNKDNNNNNKRDDIGLQSGRVRLYRGGVSLARSGVR
ncbi:hypothetical protein ACUSIJ_24045 [Pseudochelatococcus sp. B33]